MPLLIVPTASAAVPDVKLVVANVPITIQGRAVEKSDDLMEIVMDGVDPPEQSILIVATAPSVQPLPEGNAVVLVDNVVPSW